MAIDITAIQQRSEAFIAAEMEKPFRIGETDCVGTADRWVRSLTGFSPLASFGRLIRNDFDAKEWLSEPGGIAIGVNRVMRHCGFKRTATPRPGDIGLIVHGGFVSVAINTGKGWFFRDVNGFGMTPSAWKAWDIISWAQH